MMKRFILTLIFIFLLIQSSFAGSLNSELVKLYESKSEKESLPVLIVLSDRVKAVQMGKELHGKGVSLSEIHQKVMEALQAKSKETQSAVLNRMRILEGATQVSDIRPLWITNIISAKMTKAAAELIAAMPEVEEIGLDFEIKLRDVVESQESG